MEYIWIIILIAGSIISLAQKEQKKKGRPASAGMPKNDTDFGEEWQGRMSDIFGEPQPSTPPAPRSGRHPAAASDAQSVDKDHPLAQTNARQPVQAAKAAKTRQRKNTVRTSGNAKRPTPQAASAKPAQSRRDTDRSRIADDFDLERAVIYSEILKPKFEEY